MGVTPWAGWAGEPIPPRYVKWGCNPLNPNSPFGFFCLGILSGHKHALWFINFFALLVYVDLPVICFNLVNQILFTKLRVFPDIALLAGRPEPFNDLLADLLRGSRRAPCKFLWILTGQDPKFKVFLLFLLQGNGKITDVSIPWKCCFYFPGR